MSRGVKILQEIADLPGQQEDSLSKGPKRILIKDLERKKQKNSIYRDILLFWN